MICSYAPKPRMINTVAKMLMDRGYDIVACVNGDSMKRSAAGVSFDISEIISMLRLFDDKITNNNDNVVLEGVVPENDDRATFVRHMKPGETVFVYFPKEEKIGKTGINEILDNAISRNVSRVIIPLMSKCTVHVPKEIARFREESGIITETFMKCELFDCVGRHDMAPIYTVLNEKEIQELLKERHIKDIHQLPKMLENDAQARYFGLTSGMVVKENRPTIYYRVVIPPN